MATGTNTNGNRTGDAVNRQTDPGGIVHYDALHLPGFVVPSYGYIPQRLVAFDVLGDWELGDAEKLYEERTAQEQQSHQDLMI